MGDEIKSEELSENEKERRALEWEKNVRSKVNAYLDMYLPVAKDCTIGIGYIRPVKTKTETETIYNEDKAEGVTLGIKFEFLGEFDIPKEDSPTVE